MQAVSITRDADAATAQELLEAQQRPKRNEDNLSATPYKRSATAAGLVLPQCFVCEGFQHAIRFRLTGPTKTRSDITERKPVRFLER